MKVIPACLLLVLACAVSVEPPPAGFLEGHLRIVSSQEVHLADGDAAPVTPEVYAEYPLIILSRDGKKEIARVVADRDGRYRVALPPGEYILDVGRNARARVRAKPS